MSSCRGPAISNGVLEKYVSNALAVQMLSCSNLLYAALGTEIHLAFILLEKKEFGAGLYEISSYCLCWFSSLAILAPRIRWAAAEQGLSWLGGLSAIPNINFLYPCIQHTPMQLRVLKMPLCELFSMAGGLRQKPRPTHVLPKPGLTPPKIISAAKCVCRARL